MRLLVTLLLPLLLTACHAGEPAVVLGERTFRVEIADTDETRALGLMYRDTLPENRGMLFIFPREAPRAFWMMNTRIPLDILYFDRDLRLVSVSEHTPPCRSRQRCPSYPSAGPAQYVLEINAGLSAELGVEPGDRLIVRNVPGVGDN